MHAFIHIHKRTHTCACGGVCVYKNHTCYCQFVNLGITIQQPHCEGILTQILCQTDNTSLAGSSLSSLFLTTASSSAAAVAAPPPALTPRGGSAIDAAASHRPRHKPPLCSGTWPGLQTALQAAPCPPTPVLQESWSVAHSLSSSAPIPDFHFPSSPHNRVRSNSYHQALIPQHLWQLCFCDLTPTDTMYVCVKRV